MKPTPPSTPSTPAQIAADIRRRAEETLREKPGLAEASLSVVDTEKLVHELQVHQIELEMQNDELRYAQAETDAVLARYTDLYDFAPVGYLTLDDEGNIAEINLAGAKLLGLLRASLIGARLAAFIANTDRVAFDTFRQQVFVADTKQSCEVELIGEGRAPRTVHMEATLSRDRLGCRVSLIDVTELELARSEAIRANRAKSEFLAAMSHELRTPLTASLGSLGLLSSLYSENLPEQGQELLEIVTRNNGTLLRLVNELLDFEKILSGTLSVATKKHDVCALSANAVKNLLGYAQEKSINFVYDRSLCPIFADVHEHRFEQILNNLLSNAAKFSEPGSDVIISIASENSRVIVSVEDSGPGIPDEFRKDLYKPFTQADASTTRHYAGTGLGLAISKAMTEGMGGSIDFVSEVGVGTTFSVSFPASE